MVACARLERPLRAIVRVAAHLRRREAERLELDREVVLITLAPKEATQATAERGSLGGDAAAVVAEVAKTRVLTVRTRGKGRETRSS